MGNKIFKTIDEQVEILKAKGLIINNVDEAKDILFRENYFFINGYRHIFKTDFKNKSFIKGTTFNELYAVFTFDRMIRNIFFKYILIIENNIKSIISYQLSKKYGYKEKDYLNEKNYTQDSLKQRQVHDILAKMKRQIRVNGRQHSATMHYVDNYGYVPMWVLVKLLSFGIVSELYGILKLDDQLKIAEHYSLEPETLIIYLSLLSNYRNLCAHEDILYNHKTQRIIPNNKIHYMLDIKMINDEYIYGKNDLFAVIIAMKLMLSKDDFRNLIREVSYEVDLLDGKVDVIPLETILNKIGFPNNWRDIINI